jgi:hypothetical protein
MFLVEFWFLKSLNEFAADGVSNVKTTPQAVKTACVEDAKGGSMARLAGRTAIVNGGAKGIGRHKTKARAGEGARGM